MLGCTNAWLIMKLTHLPPKASKSSSNVKKSSWNFQKQKIIDYFLDAPTIKIEKLTVNSAEGYESQLTCVVHGHPKPTVQWRKNNDILKSDQNLNIINEGNRHILKIIHTKKSDFGNYTCFAENSIGEEYKHVLLSGKPTPAEFVEAVVTSPGVVRLQYRIESNSAIEEYQLEYRIKNKGDTVS